MTRVPLPIRPSEHLAAVQTATLRLLAVATVFGVRLASRIRNLRSQT
jgi:hypothetical protein